MNGVFGKIRIEFSEGESGPWWLLENARDEFCCGRHELRERAAFVG